MDERRLRKATFLSSAVNPVLSLLTSPTGHHLPGSGAESKVCLPFIPAQETSEQAARSMCCVRPGQDGGKGKVWVPWLQGHHPNTRKPSARRMALPVWLTWAVIQAACG